MPHQFTCHQCGAAFVRVGPHPFKFCSHRCYSLSIKAPLVERFWSKVEKSDGCWLWRGIVTQYGRGRIAINRRMYFAHRVAYELTYGPIPEGLLVCHNCPDGDNPLCVRPDHLFIGTQADNVQDMLSKGRQAKDADRRAKLDIGSAREIIRLLGIGEISKAAIARQFGVTPQVVYAIEQGKIWRQARL